MVTDLASRLQTAGLTRVSTEIERAALSSVRLKALAVVDEAHIEKGTTKLGGSPDLPQGFLWPQWRTFPLPFIAQIQLSDVTPHIKEYSLPNSGMLSFFFASASFFETHLSHEKTWFVCYHETSLADFKAITMPVTASSRHSYPASALVCSAELTLPDYSRFDDTSLQRLGLSNHLTDEEEIAYHDVQSQLAERAGMSHHIPLHRFLGHADPVQWDMHNQLPGVPEEWQLLLQIDSTDAGMEWGDTGRIYYWIRTKDLQQRDFSRVELILQSS